MAQHGERIKLIEPDVKKQSKGWRIQTNGNLKDFEIF
jgi:hypothetical protein